MSKLAIVDLHRAEQVSSSGMQELVGGMSCEAQSTLANGLWDLRDTFNNLGAYGAGDALDQQGREVFSGGCTF
jgi:hypothetical protein